MLSFRNVLPALGLLALAASCVGDDAGSQTEYTWDDPNSGPEGRWPGQTEFHSAAPWSRLWGPHLRTLADGTALEGTANAERQVEEADIVKVDGNRAFVLNPYRGLIAIDINDADQPRMLGRLKIQGRPQEMHLRGNTAFVLMNGMYSWNADQDYRSALLVVDVSNMSDPKLIKEYKLEGNVLESRIVGDALYAVTDAWNYEDRQSTTHVLSLNIAQADQPVEVERISFPGNGHVIHVTSEWLFVAKYQYPGTSIQAIDIRDAYGHMHVGNEVELPGYVQDKFMLDFTDSYLRVVSHEWNDGGHILVDTFSLNAESTTLSHVGHLDLEDIGRLTAARFDGTRVYLVHMVQVDPLDVVDLQDPSAPKLLDRIEIPGWLEHLEVQNSRIVGVGFDQAGTPAPQKTCEGYTYEPLASGRTLSVAIYDVAETGEVCEAGRVRFGTGNGWNWSNGFYDDKALKFLPDEDLMLVPFSGYTDEGGWSNRFTGVQIVDVDLTNLELAARGVVENASQADRSFLAQDRLMVLGHRELNVANIDDRDNPVVTASLELSRNVVAFQAIEAKGFGVQLIGDYNEPAELRVVSIDDADASRQAAWSTISVGAPAGEMWVSGNIVTVFSRSYTDEGPKAELINFDVSKPESPTRLGSLELPTGYGRDIRPLMMRRYAPTADVVRIQGDLFVVSAPESEGQRFSLISNANPSAPEITHEHFKPQDKTQVMDLKAWWGDLYVVSTVPVEEQVEPMGEDADDSAVAVDRNQSPDVATQVLPIMPPIAMNRGKVKYQVNRVTFDGGTPKIGPAINTPGRLVDVSKNGEVWTLLDNRWIEGDDGTQEQKKELFTVRVDHQSGVAPLLDGIEVHQGVEDVKVRGNRAYYTEMWSNWRGPIVPLAETVASGQEVVAPEPQNQFNLVILDYDDPADIHEASRTTLSDDGSYGNLQEVRQVDGKRYAFISMGWGGLSVFNVSDAEQPVLHQFLRSMAWHSNLTVDADAGAAWMAGGYYGVETIQLRGQN